MPMLASFRVLSLLVAAAAECPSGQSGADVTEDESLLNLGASPFGALVQTHDSEREVSSKSRRKSCMHMTNKGSHFEVMVDIGTPQQSLSVIPDTGSSILVVMDCACHSLRTCGVKGKCFSGLEGRKSSTTRFTKWPHSSEMVQRTIVYGSGSVQGIMASERIRIGQTETVDLKNGVLLVTSAGNSPTGSEGFQGIMGMGLPIPYYPLKSTQSKSYLKKLKNLEHGSRGHGGHTRERLGHEHHDRAEHADRHEDSDPDERSHEEDGPLHDASLLESADLVNMSKVNESKFSIKGNGPVWQGRMDSFSMCATPGKGILRMNPKPVKKKIANIGQLHWAVSLGGVSVGGKALKSRGGEPLTGAVMPDSGTTFIMAPTKHLYPLIASLCDNWKRCRRRLGSKSKHGSAVYRQTAKRLAFYTLISQCSKWMRKNKRSELPTIKMTVGGKGGNHQVLTLNQDSYVIGTGSGGKCRTALGALSWNPEQIGPVWIVGLPLFYTYEVGYQKKPKAMTFTRLSGKNACQRCTSSAGEASHHGHGGDTGSHHHGRTDHNEQRRSHDEAESSPEVELAPEEEHGTARPYWHLHDRSPRIPSHFDGSTMPL